MKALVERGGPKAVVRGLGPLSRKSLMDATNLILPWLASLEFGNTTSGAEPVAE